MPWLDHDAALAPRLLACLDLTDLTDTCTAQDVARLCQQAQGLDEAAQTLGPLPAVAAVCVWARFAQTARAALPASIRVAAVANFPTGDEDLAAVASQIDTILQAGAQEVDLVLPHRAWQAGDHAQAVAMVRLARRLCQGHTLKLILETGAFTDASALTQACQMGLDEGVDFLKTSTGKRYPGASLWAAHLLLAALAAHPPPAGFKASGGLRTLADVRPYVALLREHLGEAALDPARCRIGASALWQDLARHVRGAPAPTLGASGY